MNSDGGGDQRTNSGWERMGAGTKTRIVDGNENGDGNGDGNEDGIGEGGEGAKKLKKLHKRYRRDVGNRGDLGGKKKKK